MQEESDNHGHFLNTALAVRDQLTCARENPEVYFAMETTLKHPVCTIYIYILRETVE